MCGEAPLPRPGLGALLTVLPSGPRLSVPACEGEPEAEGLVVAGRTADSAAWRGAHLLSAAVLQGWVGTPENGGRARCSVSVTDPRAESLRPGQAWGRPVSPGTGLREASAVTEPVLGGTLWTPGLLVLPVLGPSQGSPGALLRCYGGSFLQLYECL